MSYRNFWNDAGWGMGENVFNELKVETIPDNVEDPFEFRLELLILTAFVLDYSCFNLFKTNQDHDEFLDAFYGYLKFLRIDQKKLRQRVADYGNAVVAEPPQNWMSNYWNVAKVFAAQFDDNTEYLLYADIYSQRMETVFRRAIQDVMNTIK